jgi:hypothetical protein
MPARLFRETCIYRRVLLVERLGRVYIRIFMRGGNVIANPACGSVMGIMAAVISGQTAGA